jgi:D-alanine-D-alanine ligase
MLRENDIHRWVRRLATENFSFAFNLCETVAGHAEGEHLAAATVELLELPKTGATAKTLLYCLNKDRCAAVLASHGIPVPRWALARAGGPPPSDWDCFPAIVKPASDDASNGVHPNSVVYSREELFEAIGRVLDHWDSAVIQEFIEGREINLAIVGNCLLPPAEIDFSTLPDGSPPIVSFEAKWISGSPEDSGTQPVCPAPLEPHVARELQSLAARAWSLMDGRGYARVDIRLTDDGSPYIIDINPNPDLSIDAGLVRQAAVAGWSYRELIERIVEAAHAAGEPGGVERDWVFVPAAVPTGEPV